MKVQLWIAAALAVACCSPASAAVKHRYSFDGNAEDSVGTADGTLVDPNTVANYGGGRLNFSANTGGSNDSPLPGAYVDLPNGIVSAAANVSGAVTVEMWAQSFDNDNWRALFTAGRSSAGEGVADGGDGSEYIQIIPQHGAGGGRPSSIRATTRAIGNVGGEGFADHAAALSTSTTQHLVAVFDQTGGLPGSVSLYVDGALTQSNPIAANLDLKTMQDINNWLGRSQWPDGLFRGWYDELRIYDHALDAARVAANFAAGADVVPEPASASLVGLAGMALVAVRRRAKR